MIRKYLIFFSLLLFSALVGKGQHFLKKGFSFRRIHTSKERIICGWNKEIEKILNQPFRYIGRGRQCFAFESQDGSYVLKLPRTDIYATPFWARILPVPRYRKEIEQRRHLQEQFIFNSFQISFHELQDQTGVLALHLGQTEKTPHAITILDAMNFKYRLPTYKTSFVLQYKKPLLIPAFLQALQNRDTEKASRILEALIKVISERAKKGVLNRDRSFLRNYGFDGAKAYQIDVGSFFKDPQMDPDAAFQKSLRDSIDPIQEWLSQTNPAALEVIKQKTKLHNIN